MNVDLDTLRGFFRLSPFMVDLGAEPTAVEPGRVTSELVLQPRHLQHTGQAHAGVMATLADHSMGSAAQTLATDGQWIVTAELKTSLMRPAKGERLVCEAWVLKAGRTLSFTEAEVYAVMGSERTLVMKASATMALTPAQKG
ncbi:MAG: PaaI family thioesterase [Vitreoscilla sp.]|nr:PaaI family thioesterase [Burkholderiales bacterium]MBP6336113.1 PaaI family thioesterase [Vitreoscilla sp.]MBP6673825.1 PaaI family thioesterase [Vitreoscilla sp.]